MDLSFLTTFWVNVSCRTAGFPRGKKFGDDNEKGETLPRLDQLKAFEVSPNKQAGHPAGTPTSIDNIIEIPT